MVNVQSDGAGDITNAVRTVAGNYETALNNLLTDASNGSMDISDNRKYNTSSASAGSIRDDTRYS